MSEPSKGVPGRYVVLVMVITATALALFALWYRDLTPLQAPMTQSSTENESSF